MRYALVTAFLGRRAGEILDSAQGDEQAINGLIDAGATLVQLPNASIEVAAERATAAYARGAGDETATSIMVATLAQRASAAPFSEDVTQTSWFLDAVTGDDSNDGSTTSTALRTMRELANRISLRRIAVAVTVTLAAGDYSADPVQFDVEIASTGSLLLLGTTTALHTGTLTGFAATVAGAASTNAGAVRGLITSAGTFAEATRVRVTSGAALDALAWVTAVPGPGQANTTRFGKIASPLTGTTVTESNPSIGDTYVVEDLPTILGRLDVRVRGPGRMLVRDATIRVATATQSHRANCDNGNANGFQTYGCKLDSAASTSLIMQGAGTWTASCCLFTSASNVLVLATSVFLIARMCCFYAPVLGEVRLQSSGQIQISSSCQFIRLFVTLQTGAVFDVISGTTNDVAWFDVPNTSRVVEVAQGGLFWTHGSSARLWGLGIGTITTTWLVQGGGRMYYAQTPSIPGGTNDVSVGGTTGAYAALPIFKTTAPGAGAVMST